MSKLENCEYSKNDIKKAGKRLLTNIKDEKALNILSAWRKDHSHPLELAEKFLKEISHDIEKGAIFAKRLKRTDSIIKKLNRYKASDSENKQMQLTTMNDIGGCRIIFSNIKKVQKLVRFLTKSQNFVVRNDYIEKPKPDGYKSIHLIGQFPNIHGELRKIELQIRTKTQHSWATALEIVDLFTDQSIKTNQIKDRNWSNFFKYCSEQFTLLEKNIFLNGENIRFNFQNYMQEFKKDKDNLEFSLYQLYSLSQKLDIIKKFDLYSKSLDKTATHLQLISDKNGNSEGYILIEITKVDKVFSERSKLKNETFQLKSSYFPVDEIDKATKEYLAAEKQILFGNTYVAALVSSNSIKDIGIAYPNYFADSTTFIKNVVILQEAYKKINPSIFRLGNKIKYLFK